MLSPKDLELSKNIANKNVTSIQIYDEFSMNEFIKLNEILKPLLDIIIKLNRIEDLNSYIDFITNHLT